MAEETYAVLKTNLGDITIQLFPNHAPKTVRNFVELAEGTREYTDPNTGKPGSGPYYDGTVFHRIIPGFMIQGGDPLGEGYGGPGFTFDDEIHPDLRFDKKYLLAMANAGIRGGRGTNGSQFFITVSTPAHLNGKHTIFGEVVGEEGKKVVDTIASVRTGAQDRPVEPVVLQSVTIERRQA
jgi:peptidyl-prolyl cis-trans isomerase A (cyclophilin A)